MPLSAAYHLATTSPETTSHLERSSSPPLYPPIHLIVFCTSPFSLPFNPPYLHVHVHIQIVEHRIYMYLPPSLPSFLLPSSLPPFLLPSSLPSFLLPSSTPSSTHLWSVTVAHSHPLVAPVQPPWLPHSPPLECWQWAWSTCSAHYPLPLVGE